MYQTKNNLKEKRYYENMLDELEKWLNEKWEQPGIKIYVSDVVTKIRELKGENNED